MESDTPGESTTPAEGPRTVDNKLQTHPEKTQELGLTDSVWDMAVRCWDQDPARRPTMVEVVRLLRKRSVSFLSAPDSRYDALPVASCYMLWTWIRFLCLQFGRLQSRLSRPDS